jgi:hypothetical protein
MPAAKKGTGAKKSSIHRSSSRTTAARTTASKKSSGRKYGPKASQSVEREMKAMKEGKLKSGSGQTVTNPKQAIAIGLSEARKSGAKAPPKKTASTKKTGKK